MKKLPLVLSLLLSTQSFAGINYSQDAIKVKGGSYRENGTLADKAVTCTYSAYEGISMDPDHPGRYISLTLRDNVDIRFNINIPLKYYPLKPGVAFKALGYTIIYSDGVLTATKPDADFGTDLIQTRWVVSRDLLKITEASALKTIDSMRRTELNCKF